MCELTKSDEMSQNQLFWFYQFHSFESDLWTIGPYVHVSFWSLKVFNIVEELEELSQVNLKAGWVRAEGGGPLI